MHQGRCETRQLLDSEVSRTLDALVLSAGSGGYSTAMTRRLRSVPENELCDDEPIADGLREAAARRGFELVSYRTANEQTVWEWRRGDGRRPQFVTERVARHWMSEWLARQPDLVQPEPLDQARHSLKIRHDAAGTVADSA
jgi:hypothetical protein